MGALPDGGDYRRSTCVDRAYYGPLRADEWRALPRLYAEHLREAHTAVKSANPNAQVVFGAVAYDLFFDNPDYLPANTTTKSVQSAYGAILWDVAPKVTVGVELLHGIREVESGADGAISRFTFSTKYAF